jgi:hypothetical protein
MPIFRVPDPEATITIEILGLAACCFNAAFTDPTRPGLVGRWEVAIPRPRDHELIMRVRQSATITVPSDAQTVKFKDRVGVKVDNPKHQRDPFNRKVLPPTSDKRDYRWLTDFTDTIEIPHSPPVQIPPGVGRAAVTKFYFYDATFYAEIDEDPPIKMVLPPHDNTGLIKERGRIIPAPEFLAGPVLDRPQHEFGHVARNIKIDIHRPGVGTGLVDILIDNEILTTIKQGANPRVITIENMERRNFEPPPGGTVKTASSEYGRGDFFRYYEFFGVTDTSPKFHLWSKKDREPEAAKASTTSPGGEPARTGDCNGVRVDSFSNLDGL